MKRVIAKKKPDSAADTLLSEHSVDSTRNGAGAKSSKRQAGKSRVVLKGKKGITKIRDVFDAHGRKLGVIVPLKKWRDIQSELETAYLMRSDKMRQRLLNALNNPRPISISLEELRAKIGI